jgi:endonuclease YncB( thermonuclease family)
LKRIPFAVLAAAVTLALAPSASAAPASAADLDCADFSDQASAQSYFLSRGGPSSDPDRLDGDADGIACELNACPCSYSSTPTTPPPPPPPAAPPPARPARVSFSAVVTAVIDGDTIRVRRGLRKGYTVRLVGIDTPEVERSGAPGECAAPDATSNMFRLGFTRPRDTTRDGLYDRKGGRGRRVKVTTDPTQDRRDQYGRLLAYVKSARGSFAGAQLRAGWAAVYVFDDPFEQLSTFQAVEAAARDAGRGAWRACSGDFHTPA